MTDDPYRDQANLAKIQQLEREYEDGTRPGAAGTPAETRSCARRAG